MSMDHLSELRVFMREKEIYYRRMVTLLSSEKFEKAFELASNDPERMEEFDVYVNEGRVSALRAWAARVTPVALEDMRVLELRQLAAPYSIEKMHTLTKPDLIKALKHAKQQHKYGHCLACGCSYFNEETNSRGGCGCEEVRQDGGEPGEEIGSSAETGL